MYDQKAYSRYMFTKTAKIGSKKPDFKDPKQLDLNSKSIVELNALIHVP